jgi:hypothetical protein
VRQAFLIQLMLPLYDNDGRAFAREESVRVRQELTFESLTD